jgi:hypothetical protein
MIQAVLSVPAGFVPMNALGTCLVTRSPQPAAGDMLSCALSL